MKIMRTCLIATFIISLIMFSCSLILPAQAEEADYHSKLVVVIKTEEAEDSWIISCLDSNGDIWEFYNGDSLE